MENSTLRVVFTGQLSQFSKRFYQRELSEIGPPRTPERRKGLTLTLTISDLNSVLGQGIEETWQESQDRFSPLF